MNGKEDSSKDELTKVEIENGDSISVIFIFIYWIIDCYSNYLDY